MNIFDLNVGLLILQGLVVLISRTWLRTSIESSVRATYEREIEEIKADLRRAEERLKSDLRTKETAITALQGAALNTGAARQAAVDNRMVAAVGDIWASFIGLAPYRAVVDMLAPYDFAKLSAASAKDQRLRTVFVEGISATTNDLKPNFSAHLARPFVTQKAWEYFTAYQTIVLLGHTKIQFLRLAVADVNKVIDYQKVRGLLKTVLPNFSDSIDLDPGSFHIFLDLLEAHLITELKSTLDGRALDQQSLERASLVIKKAHELSMPSKPDVDVEAFRLPANQ